MSILNKLEIDVTQANEVQDATSFAAKYNLPALVVHPSLAIEGIYSRGRSGGKYKIITPIDWPKGENFGMLKMRGVNLDALDSDGYEILLTPNKTEIETRNEVKVLTDFIRTHISATAEIRFVLGSLSREPSNIENMAKGFIKNRLPFLIRNDIHTKIQTSKANFDIHQNTYSAITDIAKVPIKISGNISTFQVYNQCKFAIRFGVNLTQAKAILKDYKTQNNLQ